MGAWNALNATEAGVDGSAGFIFPAASARSTNSNCDAIVSPNTLPPLRATNCRRVLAPRPPSPVPPRSDGILILLARGPESAPACVPGDGRQRQINERVRASDPHAARPGRRLPRLPARVPVLERAAVAPAID